MMFPVFTDVVTKEQYLKWNILVRKLQSYDEYGDGKGWLFHGTDHLQATHILHSGFNSFMRDPNMAPVFWGTANIAAGFAEKKAAADSPPCILAARTADVLASGLAVADLTADDTGCSFRGYHFSDKDRAVRAASDSNPPWLTSLLNTGCIMVERGRHVKGLQRHGITTLPLHPACVTARQARLEKGDGIDIPVHQDEKLALVPASQASLFPNRWLENEAYMREFHPEQTSDIDQGDTMKQAPQYSHPTMQFR
jgi:hypothetical protein